MSKVPLTSVVSLQDNPSAVTAINANFANITAAFDNTFSRDGTSPNQLLSTIDANSQRIINLPEPQSPTEVARLAEVQNIVLGVVPGIITSDNPALTGHVTAPTAAQDNNSTTVATTAFVLAQAGAATPIVDGTGTVGTSTRFSRQDHVHPSDTSKVSAASPALTGVPTVPTAAQDTNTTQIASTAFVIAQASAIAPVVDGSATVGTSLRYSREDHVHPSDTTKSPLASPTFTGTPGAPTAAVDTNTTQLATTAFVLAQAASATPIVDGSATVGTSTRFARGDHIHPSDTSKANKGANSDLTSLTGLTTPLSAAQGGTGNATYAIGDVLYASGATAISRLADVATGNVLISGGVTTAPAWGKVTLTGHVSGVLAESNGGTNQSTYATGDLLQASASNTLSKLTAVATGNVLISGGVTTASSWGKVTLTGHVSGILPIANGGTNASSASGTALDNISGFSSTGFLKRTGSGAYSFITDPLPIANGGTGDTGTAGIAFTPTVTFTGGTTVNSVGSTGHYKVLVGKFVFFAFSLVINYASAPTSFTMTLPNSFTTAANLQVILGVNVNTSVGVSTLFNAGVSISAGIFTVAATVPTTATGQNLLLTGVLEIA